MAEMDENAVMRFYDSTAEETARAWYDNDLLLCTIREFLAMLPDHPKVLDLGCGTGHEAKRLHALGAVVTGIDFSSRSIAIARERTPECTFLEINFFAIDESIGPFDGIFAAGSLIHLPLARLQEAVEKVAVDLREGGIFLAILQVGEEDLIHYPEVEGERIERIVYRHSPEALIDCFAGAGLRFVREACLAPELVESGWRAYCFTR
jgi:predicted TPR repeat methyltransferase